MKFNLRSTLNHFFRSTTPWLWFFSQKKHLGAAIHSVFFSTIAAIHSLRSSTETTPWNLSKKLIDLNGWHINHSIKSFAKDDIDKMTNNYRTCLGRGGFGEVYEGILEDGSMVAVKRFICRVNCDVKENFAKELIVHREINHKNVVRLIGRCEEEKALMLITEYVANGNLSDVLHHDNHPIPLDLRLRIAMECAEALAYMHSHMYTHVIHGDIKPDDILLDSNLHAKLSDFGISRLANTDKTLCTENVIGSIDYMDPLFRSDGRLTVKYDVYSFGVVLLELITRKKPTTVVDNANIVYAFTSALARGVRGARRMFDAEIASKDNMKIVEGFAKIAGECLIMERDKRPQMIDVVERLRVLKKAAHQDHGQQEDRFSWVRKSKPGARSAALPTPVNTSPPDKLRQFSPAEIKAATDNFSSLWIGDNVACLIEIDGVATKVSVTCLYDRWFFNSIEVVSTLRHDHLVPLIGYCHHENSIFLVYEYMARGSQLENIKGTQKPPLSWKQRLETCIGVARAPHYLHELNIIHVPMTTGSILLDEQWLAKIGDIIYFESTGYIPTGFYFGDCHPNYAITGEYTKESNVHDFGVVLLEVLCARLFYDSPLPQKQRSLVSWAWGCKEGNYGQIVDPYLKRKINPECLAKFVETAQKCVGNYYSSYCPSMGDVILDLEHALQLQDRAEASERFRRCLG